MREFQVYLEEEEVEAEFWIMALSWKNRLQDFLQENKKQMS